MKTSGFRGVVFLLIFAGRTRIEQQEGVVRRSTSSPFFVAPDNQMRILNISGRKTKATTDDVFARIKLILAGLEQTAGEAEQTTSPRSASAATIRRRTRPSSALSPEQRTLQQQQNSSGAATVARLRSFPAPLRGAYLVSRDWHAEAPVVDRSLISRRH